MPTLPLPISDHDLWQSFCHGDLPAFRQIYITHFNSLYFFALKTTQNPAASKDCVQNLFFNLWRSRHSLASVNTIKPYLFKSLRRDISRMSQRLKLGEDRLKDYPEHQQVPVFSPEDMMVDDERNDHLKRQLSLALNDLPNRQREAIYLKYYEELSYQEISTVMGINYQSVVNLLFKGLKALKSKEQLQKLTTLLEGLVFLCATSHALFW